MTRPERFPWHRLMQLGMGTLGLPPQQFWNCTLREITASLGAPEMPMVRQNLDALMKEWPDGGPSPDATRLSSSASGRGEDTSLLALA